jgi:hypothetical protein
MQVRSLIGRWAFSLAFTAALLCLVELWLRSTGAVPGDVSPDWANFRKVDTLVVTDEFIVDSLGIMRANPEFGNVWGKSINSLGFHSPELSGADTTAPSVMLIGDSFVWGMTASHDDSSFASILRAEAGMTVHNFGIPATDPVQYALVAEHYIPVVRPRAVMVFFFMGNDLMFHDREVKPFRPQFVTTNAGAIMLDIEGRRFSDVVEAYDFLVNERYHLSGQHSLPERVIRRSALLSRLYSIRFRIEEKVRWERGIRDLSISNRYLMAIKRTAERNGAEFRIIVIPERKEANMARDRYETRYGHFMFHPSLRPHIHWPEVRKDLYVPYPDAHLNDRGHRVYADFIRKLLEEMGE